MLVTKESEGSVSTNIHIAEERGQTIHGDHDEEDPYLPHDMYRPP